MRLVCAVLWVLAFTRCDGVAVETAPADAGRTTDAGPTDAGTPDAAVSDAGLHDAGVDDAGAVDAGLPDAGATLDAGVDAGSLHPVFVAVGYNALRVRSLDLGLTWVDEQRDGVSGDNEFLIRGIGWGNGLFVAARGFPNGLVRVSPDGKTWTSHTAPSDQWMAGVVYAGSHFVAVGSGQSWTSPDGTTWAVTNPFPTAMRTLVVGGSQLMAAGSDGRWFRSADSGATWQLDSGSHSPSNEVKIAWCGSGFVQVGDGNFSGVTRCPGFTRTRGMVHGAGVWLRANAGGIERSLDGTQWTRVFTGAVEDLELGWVP